MMKRMIKVEDLVPKEEAPHYQDVPLPDNPIITAHVSQLFPSKLKGAGTCVWINQKGRNTGGECGKPTFGDNKWCSAHITIDLMNKGKEKKTEKKQITIIEDSEPEEDFEEIQTPFPTPLMLPAQNHDINREERLLNIIEGMMVILTQIKIR